MRRKLEVVAAYIQRDGLVLLDRRRKGSHLEDRWEFPGGKREDGESDAQALLREIDEELGVTGTVTGDAIASVEHPYEDFDVILTLYPVSIEGTPHAKDVAEIHWFPIEELSNLAMPPADKPLITAIIQRQGETRTMERTGRCLCGAITYTASDVKTKTSACHCGMCRRWAGGPFFGVMAKSITWTGEDALASYPSSAWAERAFCKRCGTGLYYRLTAEGPYKGATSLALGTLDDQTGFELEREWFIDKKPDHYELAGEHQCVTEAEAMAMFTAEGPPDDAEPASES